MPRRKKTPKYLTQGAIVLAVLLALGFGLRYLRYRTQRASIRECMSKKQYGQCLVLVETLLQKRLAFYPGFNDDLQAMVNERAKQLPATAAYEFLVGTENRLKNAPIDDYFFATIQIEYLYQMPRSEFTLAEANRLKTKKLTANSWFMLGKIFAEAGPAVLDQAAHCFDKALEDEPKLRSEPSIVETLKKLLETQLIVSSDPLIKLLQKYFFADLKTTLERGLKDRENVFLRQNSFFILDEFGQVGEADRFSHNLLNLLYASTSSLPAFQEAVKFFEHLDKIESTNWRKLADDGDLWQLDDLKFLDGIPTSYSEKTARLLLEQIPKTFSAELKKCVKKTKHSQRRANCFHILSKEKKVTAHDKLKFYRQNLKFKSYPHFYDWLIDSIDYFGRRGYSGKAELKSFATRMRSLKLKSSGESKVVYADIENYTRTKIGKRN